ncbi:MAG: hypothetical protein ACJ8GO_06935 [Ramlibacter sp.]
MTALRAMTPGHLTSMPRSGEVMPRLRGVIARNNPERKNKHGNR